MLNKIRKFLYMIVSCILVIGVLLTSAAVQVLAQSSTSGLQVDSLLTNGLRDPQAIDPGAPRFSWQISGQARNIRQQAYQIIISDALSPKKTVWDSGKTSSAQSSNVIYTGPKLSSDTSYCWKVRVWSTDGEVSEYSDTAFFRIGLDNTDWSASYIWDGSENRNDFAYFRKSFTVDKQIAEAVVYTTAHNDYQLYLNGKKIGVGPARSDPYTYGQYCAYDVTDALTQGQNAFAALAHWHGVWSDSGVNAQPAYILEAHIRYTDGSVQTVKTDGSWKMSSTTPYVESNPVYFGFYGGVNNRASVKYDASKEIPGWNTADFDDSGWKNAVEVKRDNYRLYAQLVSEETEMERAEPLSVKQQGDKWIVDFGKCLTGWPELKLHSNQSGDQVKIQYWEVETGWGDAGYDTYRCAGGEEIFYAPYIRHTSFRLLEISGYKGTLTDDDVRGIVAYSYADKQGSFESSDSRLNAVYEMSERSGRQNVQQGIISVDANREQSPWTADSWNIGIGCLYNHSNTMLIDKIVKDYAGEQLDNGNFLTCSPARDYHSEMAEWSLYWPMLLWQQYLFSGDQQLLLDYYPNLVKFLNYIGQYRNRVSGLYNPPGWRASDYAGGSLENGGENIATNSQIYMDLSISAAIAEILGNQSDSEAYSSKADNLKVSINQNLLVNGEKYRTSTSSGQTHPLGTAWALRAGVVPEVFKDRVTEWFAGQKNNYDVGGYGGDALYNGLYTAGLGKIAAADFARYDNMLNTNNTNWESFGELSIDNMGNHAWTAYPSYLLQRYVGGIQPTGGGFETVDIAPVTDGLDWAKSTVPTIKGDIKTEWEQTSESELSLTAVIPGNTVATVILPNNDMDGLTVSESGKKVFENGQFVKGAEGILDGKAENGKVVLTVGSGSYTFTVTGNPLHSPDIGGDKPITGIILDDAQARFTGDWMYETASNKSDRYGDAFHYARSWTGDAEPTAFATYTAKVEEAGKYSVYAWWGTHPNRATNTPYTVTAGDTTETVRVNQENDGGKWNLLGSYDMQAGDTITVQISNNANEYVIADAVRIDMQSDDTDELSEIQRLQLLVYDLIKTDTSNCTQRSVVREFNQALEAAEDLCSRSQWDEEETAAAYDRLQKAHQAVLDNQKPNLALNKSIAASEQVEAPGIWNVSYLTDGYKAQDNISRVGYTSADFKTQDISAKPIDITIDLEQVQQINELSIYPRVSAVSWLGSTPNFPQDFEIQVSGDGNDYKTVFTAVGQSDPDFQPLLIRFDDVEARFVRLHVTKLGEYAGDENQPGNSTPYRLQLSEIEVYNTPLEEPEADKTGLKELYDKYKDAQQQDYTPDSWSDFSRAMSAAEDVLADENASQSDVNTALENLKTAAERLEAVSDLIMGDVDNNGVVNVSDIITLKNLIMNSSWTEEQLKRGDINADNNLTVGDMLSIKNIIMAG